MRTFVCALLALPFSLNAQDTRGGCSITLLSDPSTLGQVWCLDPPVATIEPIVWLVQGTGIQVNFLPPGVSASLSNDTLTISGTITSQGFHNAQVTTSEGCNSQNMAMYMSVIVDPGFSCTVEGSDVILHWPGMNAPLEIGGEQILLSCTSDDGFVDVLDLPLPGPDSVVWSGLPMNTVLTFGLSGSGRPYCFPGYYETTCTITSTDISEHEEGDPLVRIVLHDDVLRLAASKELHDVRIYDMLGALVLSRTVRSNTASIPIASLGSGAFVLRVVGADGRVVVQRFVKK
ncbi:MAG TPA: T9SS type A sorting domain-containing protein [Flavobacteriales bacterium]|nr:T9SS type A sorting domain-containing protein [Flavobacteriales bacterium]